MTRGTEKLISELSAEEYAERAAVAEFILLAQSEIQRLLNRKGMRYKELAQRLGVTEARVSQMFGDNATNLTLKSLARIFYHLGETAYVSSVEEIMRERAAAGGLVPVEDVYHWTAVGLTSTSFQVSLNVELDDGDVEAETLPALRGVRRWMAVEAAAGRCLAA